MVLKIFVNGHSVPVPVEVVYRLRFYIDCFVVDMYLSYARRIAYHRRGVYIIIHIAFLRNLFGNVLHVRVTRKHNFDALVGKEGGYFFPIAEHIAGGNHRVHRRRGQGGVMRHCENIVSCRPCLVNLLFYPF